MSEAKMVENYRDLLGVFFMSGQIDRYNLIKDGEGTKLHYKDKNGIYIAEVPEEMVDITKKFLKKKETPEERRQLMGWKIPRFISLDDEGEKWYNFQLNGEKI